MMMDSSSQNLNEYLTLNPTTKESLLEDQIDQIDSASKDQSKEIKESFSQNITLKKFTLDRVDQIVDHNTLDPDSFMKLRAESMEEQMIVIKQLHKYSHDSTNF